MQARVDIRSVMATASAVAALALSPPASAGAADETLSWRLRELANRDLRTASPGEQGDAVSLLPRGPGSLLRYGDALVVEIRVAGPVSGRADALRGAGAEIIGVTPGEDTITASVDERELRAVAATPGVEWVAEQITPIAGSAGDGAGTAAINTCPTGVVSEGDAQLKAAQARTTFDVDGSGVKVGVLSDSFDTRPTGINAAEDVSSGDLPGPGNPCGRTGAVQVIEDFAGSVTVTPGDEGRAMLQIVHDLAPGSSLAFATAFTGQTQFADNIRALAAAGARVIVDDVSYFREPMYQDGIIARAINDVTAQGVAYFSAAGNNNGNGLNSFEAPGGYRPMACPPEVLALRDGGANSCMDFDPAGGTEDATFDLVLDGMPGNSSPFRLSMSWAEPRFGVSTDFDVYVINPSTGTASLEAEEPNLASQDPTEFGSFGSFGGTQELVIRRYAGTGTPRIKFINSDNGADTILDTQDVEPPDVQGPTIFGHNGAANAQTTAAVPFSDSSVVEGFSSRGPVTYLFEPVIGTSPAPPLGAPFSPPKPDVAASNRTINTFFGLGNRFAGTSAAAPHAAAVGALQLEANPTLSQTQVKAAQRDTADPVGAFPPEAAGAGLIDAAAAIASAPPPPPRITVESGTGLTRDNTPTLGFSVLPPDPRTLTCRVDGGAAQPCSPPFTTSRLADGDHSVRIDATDYFGAAGAATAELTVDTKKPKLKLRRKPKKRTEKTKARFKVATERGARLECKLDREGFDPCRRKPKFEVDEGGHKLRLRATDAAGNRAKLSYRWRVVED